MNFYMEIAKLRAARMLWGKLMKVIGQAFFLSLFYSVTMFSLWSRNFLHSVFCIFLIIAYHVPLIWCSFSINFCHFNMYHVSLIWCSFSIKFVILICYFSSRWTSSFAVTMIFIVNFRESVIYWYVTLDFVVGKIQCKREEFAVAHPLSDERLFTYRTGKREREIM